MTWFRERRASKPDVSESGRARLRLPGGARWLGLLAGVALSVCCVRAGALEAWMQHVVAGTPIEAALYRAMALPGVEVLFPRPPEESVAELSKLMAGSATATLYSLRAQQEEQALDFRSAETDWKLYARRSPDGQSERAGSDTPNGMLALADFYHQRLQPQDEFATLLEIASSPASPKDSFLQPEDQRAWRAWERAFSLANDQAFADPTVSDLWRRWVARYPRQATVYGRAFTWEIEHGRKADAQAILAAYGSAFPQDQVFPVKAAALLALHDGGADGQARALAVYDKGFEPLWPEALIQAYFNLLDTTHQARRFLGEATARVQRNPDDLNAAARLFFYYRQQGHPDAALAGLDAYGQGKAQRGSAWTAEELYTLAQLAASVQAYPQAARYDFALAHLEGAIEKGAIKSGRSAHEAGLAGLVDVLLTAPEQPIALGAGNLSLYRDIATVDQGPGLWNGVLSLWLNGQSPGNAFAAEEQKAQPYFHRAKAAELLTLLDKQAPGAPGRDALHAKLLQAYAEYGDNGAVVRAGAAFLDQFPQSAQRVTVALAMADAYARENDGPAELALYDRLLEELGRQTQKMPLSAAALDTPASEGQAAGAMTPGQRAEAREAFLLDTGAARLAPNPAASAYALVLDRYLGRLTAAHQLPEALAVLRKELDRNPDDPALYERLAAFLEQNNLSAQQEEVYRSAIQKFGEASWYDKLARFYLRQKRLRAFATLTRQVTDIFAGTELDGYFRTMHSSGSALFVEVNLYAHTRFPHDLVFTQNLLNAYSNQPTADSAAWEGLLRQTWWQTPELTRRFFEFLSANGKLDAELARIPDGQAPGVSPQNPAAQLELAQAALWRSHYEQGGPLFIALAENYPANEEWGRTAAELERSLAWLDPAGPAADTAAAVRIEERLLATDPANLDRLARIGDILADHADVENVDAQGSAPSLAEAARFWRKMPAVAPGRADNYLQAATVFWDYFQFDDALKEIELARSRFHEPALYAYEAGAIAEGKGDGALAVREYVHAAVATTGGIMPGESGPATARLMQLARRPATAALVDQATVAELKSGGPASIAAIELRVAVLDTVHRSADATPLLLASVTEAQTLDQAEALAAYAEGHGQTAVHEAALVREAELAQDPVEKLQLRYELATAEEGRGDLEAASRLIETIYRENARLLGVVRGTVDFDWRTERRSRAIAVLLEAAQVAQPELGRQFKAEAAGKANQMGETQQARSLAESLLADDPYNPQYLALAADSFAGPGGAKPDSAGLAAFYQSRLEAVKTAPMSGDDRKARTALLRKGLIPALTRSSNYAGAVDQYTALLSAYPEDSSLANEAALYALRYDREPQLLDFLRGTTKTSPRDSRFFIDLAATETVFGDPSAAIEDYAHAVAIRSDRADLYSAKAGLEETLGRFDEAVTDYGRLYQLSYKDPQWMVAIARARARQGRAQDAAAALATAYLRGSQSLPREYFRVASQLEAWNLLQEARGYAEQGAQAAGDDLLSGDEQRLAPEDPATYARILTRLRQTDEVFATLRKALAAAAVAPSSPGVIAAQVQQQGLAAVSDAEWRSRRVEARKQQASAQYTAALAAMGAAVDSFATPEEKSGYASQLAAQRQGAPPDEIAARWIPAAHAAGLSALEAEWRKELLLAPGKAAGQQVAGFVELERGRLLFKELGEALSRFVQMHAREPELEVQALASAAEAYRAAGDLQDELRVLGPANPTRDDGAAARRDQELRRRVGNSVGAPGMDDGGLRERYLRLLLHHDAQGLVAVAGSGDEGVADAAANLALAEAPREIALAAVASRGRSLPAVWSAAYGGLAGLYLRDTSAATGASFDRALRLDATIGERLAARPDTARQLTGAEWFYEAGRFGQWRSLATGDGDAEEVLAADLEGARTADNYRTLAATYSEAGKMAAALAELEHALELEPRSAELESAQAVLLWEAGRKSEALAAWRAALADLLEVEDRGAAPASFWTDFRQVTEQMRGRSGAFAELKPQMDAVLRDYLRRNGSYRSNELLEAAYKAAPNKTEGVKWVLALVLAAREPVELLAEVDRSTWMGRAAREAWLEEELRLVRASGSGGSNNSWRLSGVEGELLRSYMEPDGAKPSGGNQASARNAKALSLLQSLTDAQRALPEFAQAALVLAGRTGSLDARLASYRAQPDAAPEAKILEAAAAELAREDRQEPARALLEFAFERGQSTHTLAATEYLALAEARLRTGDSSAAVATLQSLATFSGSGGDSLYANLDSAATLLTKYGRLAEALPFLTTLARDVPWQPEYALRLAEAERRTNAAGAAGALAAVAGSPLAAYALRIRAALDLAHTNPAQMDLKQMAQAQRDRDQASGAPAKLGSAELALLSSPRIAAQAARQPYFVAARVAAADSVNEVSLRVQLLEEALAIAPADPGATLMRLALFRALFAEGEMALARGSLDVMLERSGGALESSLLSSPASFNAEPTAGAQAGAEAVLYREIAAVYLATSDEDGAGNDRGVAIGYLQRARAAMPPGAEARSVAGEIAELQAAARLEAVNAGRRPLIRKVLAQASVVRSRLERLPDDGSSTEEP